MDAQICIRLENLEVLFQDEGADEGKEVSCGGRGTVSYHHFLQVTFIRSQARSARLTACHPYGWAGCGPDSYQHSPSQNHKQNIVRLFTVLSVCVCVSACVNVEVKGQYGVSSSVTLYLIFGDKLLLLSKPAGSSRIAGQGQGPPTSALPALGL